MGQAALHRRLCPCCKGAPGGGATLLRFPVGEREIGQHSDPRWRGKNWQPSPAILGTATWTPGKSSLFLLMGMQDHGFESIDLRWFSHPVQQSLPALWVEIHVVHGKPRGAPRPVACPYQEPQQVSWAKSLWSMEQCSQGKSAKWRCNLGRSLGSKGWLLAPSNLHTWRAARRPRGCWTVWLCALVGSDGCKATDLELLLPRGT